MHNKTMAPGQAVGGKQNKYQPESPHFSKQFMLVYIGNRPKNSDQFWSSLITLGDAFKQLLFRKSTQPWSLHCCRKNWFDWNWSTHNKKSVSCRNHIAESS